METSTAVARAEKSSLPFFDLQAQFATIRGEVLQAVGAVLDSQHFILGQQVELFEQEFAAYVDAQFAVGCASGTDALLPGAFGARRGARRRSDYDPLYIYCHGGFDRAYRSHTGFCRYSPGHLQYSDPDLIEQSVTRRTRAILPVHLFGLTAELRPILEIAHEHDLAVIEDSAQADWSDLLTVRRRGVLAVLGVSVSFLRRTWDAREMEE